MLRGLLRGSTGDDDELAILRILRASERGGELVLVVDAADAWELMYSCDGEEYGALRALLRRSYYGQTQLRTAVRLAEKCLSGQTSGWGERMVVDLVLARGLADRRSLLEHLGGGQVGAGAGRVRDDISGAEEVEFDAAVRGLGV